jgi:hypothetical protein
LKVLLLNGDNHNFHTCAPIVESFLSNDPALSVVVTEDREALRALDSFDVFVFGTGFTRAVRHDDGTVDRLPDLTPDQEEGLNGYVHDGGGLVGIHGTGWWIPARSVPLIGGHANWHPPGLTFDVTIDDDDHPIMKGIEDFEVEDEIYMSAWDPGIHVLASATWQDKQHPMAWTHHYGEGKVFYTTLGHGPNTFEVDAFQQMIVQAVKWAGN